MGGQRFLDPAGFLTKSNVNKGLPYQHNFLVTLSSLPPLLASNVSLEDLSWNALDVSVPGVNLGFTSNSVAGRPRYYAQERQDQDLSIVFLDDASMSIRRLFETWIQLAFDPYAKTRKYPSEYQAPELNINTMDQHGNLTYMDCFLDVFPYLIADLDYSRSSYELIKTRVTFKYRIHVLDNANTSNRTVQSKIVK
jgi:hypothetical protein